MSFFSDLNLNGNTPPRNHPEIGHWGPKRVPSVKDKKRARILVTLVFVASCVAVGLAMKFFFEILMNS